MDKAYDPKKYEGKIYRAWEKSGYFAPENLPPPSRKVSEGQAGGRRERFSMVLPPPNVTGTLHVGSAFMLVIEDILTRYHRMGGKRTLWIPGTDHAAIATQAKVERLLWEKEKKTRHDLGRDEFLRRVETFARENHDRIVHQIKKMGSSLDWSREAFTLDEKRQTAVFEAFRRMYEAGLIYRGHRVVNWDPQGQTTVSDEEVAHRETKGTLYTFRYAKDFPIPIATTRPETKLGDTAVAVHPHDARYKKYVGQTLSANFAGVPLELTVVADEAVDPEFGTGAVGVTPAHSMTDWEIAQRHKLPLKQVIDENARVTVELYKGKTTLEAREEIVAHLKKEELLEKEEEILMNVGTAQRTGGVIEPLPKLQWFVNVSKPIAERGGKSLKELVREPVERGEITILPGRFKNIYFNWIDNLRDWCISRQIWYGHRIPVWYARGTDAKQTQKDAEKIVVSTESPGEGWEQDPDTLDTWFSSGLWTFSTLDWPSSVETTEGRPEKTGDLKTFHPTDVLETGYDILFFWVARMILMSQFLLDEVPFRTVYLHGLVRDEKRRKLSKSLDSLADPIEIINRYGTDALRMALIVGVGPGSDSILSEEKVKAYKHFANKIWNAARFVLANVPPQTIADIHADQRGLSDKDNTYLKELNALAKDVTGDIENFRLHLASEKLYHYFWHTFADIIIEEQKPRLSEKDEGAGRGAQLLLYTILTTQLKLLHPFMPFITEAIWSKLPHKDKELLMISEWPKQN